ncbi:diacylglycerol O-acyltransferase 2D-like isoform X1 [Cajanus cajan]|uniref:diacylglycerol O-acyltransferase 2D-like isoform X1 n=1 Tax=Cajanus cajan TaxID=3821 RepID=UPI00098DAEA5|nr:diacylglycerol O-acyltransferase 2D-like isoform X1 [Cajanus cajan]
MEKVLNGAEEFSESCNMLKMVLALALYLGTIHFNLALIFFATFFLPLSKALLVFGSLLVLVMIPVDENSMFGRKLSKYICRHICSYFPITLHIEEVEAFRPNQAYVFGYEPHSVNPIGMIALGHSAGFMPLAKTKLLASRAIFYIPFMRHTWTWLGFTSVSKKNFISSLAAGYSCIVVPGGIRETLFMEPGCENVFLKERRGFVRIALEMGLPLVPVFCFGQTDTYKWWKAPGKLIQNLARILKITPLFFWGIYGSPIPFKIPLYVVVGRPIKVEKNPQPTMDQVAKVHNQFVDELQDLFNRHKAQAGYTNLELKII